MMDLWAAACNEVCVHNLMCKSTWAPAEAVCMPGLCNMCVRADVFLQAHPNLDPAQIEEMQARVFGQGWQSGCTGDWSSNTSPAP
jgi:hypothetical protein